MNNQTCMVRPTLIDLNPNELYYYPFTIIMVRCDGSCCTFKDPGGIISVPNKMEDINLKVFNIIYEINESRTFEKHISCECRCEFDGWRSGLDKLTSH